MRLQGSGNTRPYVNRATCPLHVPGQVAPPVRVAQNREYELLLERQRERYDKLKHPVFKAFALDAVEPSDVNQWSLRCLMCAAMLKHRRGAG